MDAAAELRVEIATLRAKVDALQADLREVLALHRETLQALELVMGGPARRGLLPNG
jgi:DNA-binding XRE family transcriptional regulator